MPALSANPLPQRVSLANLALAIVVISVVALMIIPLPTWLLDVLLAANLAASVALLLVTLQVTDALKISTFPTILLLTTLIRLGLNVASTRLILLQTDAGRIISAFGDFVVRGNYAVGAVVFLILIIIQFVVIAKGSERVAEVGARFTLDAMPGKQLAIDGELRSGSIDAREAQRRRRHLERESQFYGAMDGAMKFVKGDVIASFLITAINIVGGLAIGVATRGMPFTEALQRYGLLTIGDGLVTQIPALVLATAAGVLVTRVASDDLDRPLGEEIGRQLLGEPRALFAAAIFLIALALTPGLPSWPFVAVAAMLGVAGHYRRRRRQAGDDLSWVPLAQDETSVIASHFVPVVTPWALHVGPAFATLAGRVSGRSSRQSPDLDGMITAARECLFRDLGVILPGAPVLMNPALDARTMVLNLHEIPTLKFELPLHLSVQEVPDHVLSNILPVLRRRAGEYLGIAQTQSLLDKLEQIAPAAVRQVVPKPVGVAVLSEILQRLVVEGVSIRNLAGILEALAQPAKTESDPLVLVESVRVHLRRALTHELAGGSRELDVCLLDPSLEDVVRGAIRQSGAGSPLALALAPAAARDIIQAVKEALSTNSEAQAILLTQPDVRRFVSHLLRTELPDLKVISFAELSPEVTIRPSATARIGH